MYTYLMYRLKELAIILILVGFLAYLPSFFGNFVWDDEDFVYANKYVQNFQLDKFWTENAIAGRGKMSNYYRPIQFSMYSILYKVAGPNPFVYHLAGVILHITAAVLVFIVLSTITKISFVAFLTALLFLIHPIQTESVSYISGHSDPLYVLFFFLSIFFFLKRNKRLLYKVLSVCFFILSLLSKELALILPGIIMLIMLFKRHPDENQDPDIVKKTHLHLDSGFRRNDVLFIGLFFLIDLLYLISRFTFLKFSDISQYWIGNPYGEHFFIRLATFFRTFFTSLGLLFFPIDLFMERDFTVPIQHSLFNPWTAGFFILNAGIIVILYLNKRQATKHYPLFFYLCFLISLIPYVGIFLLNGIYYEHFLYLPMIFFWASMLSFLSGLISKKILKYIVGIILILYLFRSYVRQWDWIDNERFYRQTLSHAPKSIRIINGLGMTLGEKNNCQEAITVYKQAIMIDKNVPNLYHNIANCYVSLGNNKEAETYYLTALKINPKFTFSAVNLYRLYLQTNQKDKATQIANTFSLLH